jgi:peptidoglycan/LPS O-acetylase OafA/YrhL
VSEAIHAPHQRFRADIQGLRALAILLVVVFHAGVGHLTGGFVGVDVFFVISGYLITSQLRAELSSTGTISIPGFIARRVRRLLPAAAVVLIATLALSSILLPPLEFASVAASARSAGAYVSNLHFLGLASDYFTGDVKTDPLLHTWSLSVEEQFYLAWPVLLLIGCTSWRRQSATRRRLAWTMTAIALASFLATWWYVDANRQLAFYGSPLRAWEFACGGLASLIEPAPRRPLPRRLLVAGGWIGMMLVIGAAALFSANTDFPGATALVPVAGTSALLVLGRLHSWPDRWSVVRFLSAAPMQWIGARSYSWYLWHWPLLVLATATIPQLSVMDRVSIVAVALVLSHLTYRFVEMPFRASRHTYARGTRPVRRTLAFGFAATVATIAVSEIARRTATARSRSPEFRAYTAAASDVARPHEDGCVNASSDDRVRVCRYGSDEATQTMVLFGDSHAVQWFPALESIAAPRGWALLVIAKSRCATARVPVYEVNSPALSIACERWRHAAVDTILNRRPDLVVLSNASVYISWPLVSRDMPAVSASVWQEGVAHTLGTFNAHGIPTVTIHDTPFLVGNVPKCLARSGWIAHQTDACATERTRAFNPDVQDAETRARASIPNSYGIDLSDHLCQSTICPPVVSGIIAYSDNEHLSATVARRLAPVLGRALNELGLFPGITNIH